MLVRRPPPYTLPRHVLGSPSPASLLETNLKVPFQLCLRYLGTPKGAASFSFAETKGQQPSGLRRSQANSWQALELGVLSTSRVTRGRLSGAREAFGVSSEDCTPGPTAPVLAGTRRVALNRLFLKEPRLPFSLPLSGSLVHASLELPRKPRMIFNFLASVFTS